MRLKSFIFVHDQTIVRDFINLSKFSELENLKYVFLGDSDHSQIKDLSNVIICKELEYNIEYCHKMTYFTGWWALWKNNLIQDCDYLNLFEYDININKNFNDILHKNLNVPIIGYASINNTSPLYKDKSYIESICFLIKKHYKVDVNTFLNYPTEVSVTSNHTLSYEFFNDYMSWIEPMLNELKSDDFSGHNLERSISIFYNIYKIPHKIINNVIKHFFLNSHNTTKVANKDRFISDYHKLLR